ncbi:hypothetical protein T492DRAFT_970827 [Pavlovales sp. CCMP2436]|nr:hypothetical protein T492DRAFT_970827 [Pavlovales sp. CCMP2436]
MGSTAAVCQFAWLGQLGYTHGLRLQRALVLARQVGRIPDTLLLLEHPPVFTLGKRREEAERNIIAGSDAIRAMGATIEECDRGGDVTYHGPGQLVAYPIVHVSDLPQRGVRKYVEALEDVMIEAAGAYGLVASGRRAEETGAWIGNRKLGAVGVRVSKRISSHGIALNVCTDLRAFGLIVPCGLKDRGVTSIAAELGLEGLPVAPTAEEAARKVQHIFGDIYERRMVEVEGEGILSLLSAAAADTDDIE